MTQEEFGKVLKYQKDSMDMILKSIEKSKKRYPSHTEDESKWGQEEVEAHQASLNGDNPCYFCNY